MHTNRHDHFIQYLKTIFTNSQSDFFLDHSSVRSTFQLFYFGTSLPDKGEHDNEHYEHHDKSYVPWWQLYRYKE